MYQTRIRTLSFVLSAATLMAGQAKNLAELTRESPSIVLAHVETANSYVGADGEVYTDVSVSPESVLKGGGAAQTFTVKGGVIGDLVVAFSDVPRFTSGEDVVLFNDEAGQPVEKIELNAVTGAEVLSRIEQARRDDGAPVGDFERSRAQQFINKLGLGTVDLPASVCAAFTGAKWATPATTFTLHASLPAGWASSLQAATAAWNSAGSKFAFAQNSSSPHVISIGDLGTTGTLASTRYAYYQSNGQIVNFSMTFNSRYAWSTTGEAGKIDVQAIATHEFGHALGLNHPAASSCSEETMWASAAAGETKKRSLEAGDKDGVLTLYGAASGTTTPPPPPPPTPAAPTVSSFALVTPRAVATKPMVILFQGAGFNPVAVQALFRGGPCGTTGCLSTPLAASAINVVFYNQLPAGAYTVAVRNGATGAFSAVQSFTVNPN